MSDEEKQEGSAKFQSLQQDINFLREKKYSIQKSNSSITFSRTGRKISSHRH